MCNETDKSIHKTYIIKSRQCIFIDTLYLIDILSNIVDKRRLITQLARTSWSDRWLRRERKACSTYISVSILSISSSPGNAGVNKVTRALPPKLATFSTSRKSISRAIGNGVLVQARKLTRRPTARIDRGTKRVASSVGACWSEIRKLSRSSHAS